MITESIKKLLGEDLAKFVDEALKGKGKDGKDVDVVVGNDGTYVPSDKHDAIKGEAEAAKKTLDAVASTLKDLGGTGKPEDLAADVLKAKSTVDTLKSDHEKELANMRKVSALKLPLSHQFHDPDDVIAMLDLDKVELDGNGGLKTDIDGLVKPIAEKKPHWVKPKDESNIPAIKGAKPADPAAPPDGAGAGSLDDAIRSQIFGNEGES